MRPHAIRSVTRQPLPEQHTGPLGRAVQSPRGGQQCTMGTSSLLDIRDVYTEWHGVEHFATDLGSSFCLDARSLVVMHR